MARPKNDVNRTKMLHIRMTDDEFKKLEKLSECSGKTVSKCVRDIVDFNYNAMVVRGK